MNEWGDIIDLDESWISEFETSDNEYKLFYKEDIHCITVRSIFIDKQLTIQRIKKEPIVLKTPNRVSREEVVSIIKRTTQDTAPIKYSLLSILKYNIDLEPVQLNTFLKSNNKISFLSTVNNVDTVSFGPSIYLFQDLNELVFLFYEKLASNNVTKRVFINSSSVVKNKTVRKQLKDEPL